jgi:hypothetical protein
MLSPDQGPVVIAGAWQNHRDVHADSAFIAQFLLLVALMAATIEYCEVVQRRAMARRFSALREEAALTGLKGRVRIFIADND